MEITVREPLQSEVSSPSMYLIPEYLQYHQEVQVVGGSFKKKSGVKVEREKPREPRSFTEKPGQNIFGTYMVSLWNLKPTSTS